MPSGGLPYGSASWPVDVGSGGGGDDGKCHQTNAEGVSRGGAGGRGGWLPSRPCRECVESDWVVCAHVSE